MVDERIKGNKKKGFKKLVINLDIKWFNCYRKGDYKLNCFKFEEDLMEFNKVSKKNVVMIVKDK